jgi:hypothetical protein
MGMAIRLQAGKRLSIAVFAICVNAGGLVCATAPESCGDTPETCVPRLLSRAGTT